MNGYEGDLISVAALLDHADEPWRDCAERAVRHLASVGAEFTADDLTEMGVPDPDHPSRWGSLFAALKAEGLIVVAGYKASTRKSRNGGVCRSWIGATAALNAA